MNGRVNLGWPPIRRWITPFTFLSLALVAAMGLGGREAAGEGPPPQISTMAISVMPEYDQPRVLASYRAELNPDIALPQKVRLRVPGDTTVEHACSLKPSNDEHICEKYALEPDGQDQALTYEITTNIMYVELYYGSVSGAGQRALDFAFWPPYPIKTLDLFVQEPSQATDFTLSPAPANSMDEQGFRHHTYSFQDLPVDKPVSIQMTYTRPTDQPSVPPRDSASAAEAGAQPAGAESGGIPQAVILLLSLAGAAVLGIVLYTALARRFHISLVTPSSRTPLEQGGTRRPETFFCRHCGQRVSQEFAFCPGCGQGVRLPVRERQ